MQQCLCRSGWTFGQEGDAMPPASSREKALNELERMFGSRFSVAQSIREHHSRDESVLAPALPDGVIFLWDLDEWVTILGSYNRSLDWAGATAGLTRRLRMAVVS